MFQVSRVLERKDHKPCDDAIDVLRLTIEFHEYLTHHLTTYLQVVDLAFGEALHELDKKLQFAEAEQHTLASTDVGDVLEKLKTKAIIKVRGVSFRCSFLSVTFVLLFFTSVV